MPLWEAEDEAAKLSRKQLRQQTKTIVEALAALLEAQKKLNHCRAHIQERTTMNDDNPQKKCHAVYPEDLDNQAQADSAVGRS